MTGVWEGKRWKNKELVQEFLQEYKNNKATGIGKEDMKNKKSKKDDRIYIS